MHWMRIVSDEEAQDETVTHVNLSTVTSVVKQDYGLLLCHGKEDITSVDLDHAPAILARLDTLAEIATRRTHEALEPAPLEGVFEAFTKKEGK